MSFVRMKFSVILALLLTSAVFAADEKKEEKTPMNSPNEVAVIKTSEGDMVVQFWTDAARNTVENFKKLARQHFYDGTIFHRIVKGKIRQKKTATEQVVRVTRSKPSLTIIRMSAA